MRIIRLDDQGLRLIEERSYRDEEFGGFGEASLQELLVEHPDVIPSEEIDPDDPPRFVVIQSEAGVTPGSIDVLLADHRGVPTIIEAKLMDNREIRRSVVAQGLEYLSHVASEWDADRFVDAGRRFWQSRDVDFSSYAADRLGDVTEDEWYEHRTAICPQGTPSARCSWMRSTTAFASLVTSRQ